MVIDKCLIEDGVGMAIMTKNMDKFKNHYEALKSVKMGSNVTQLKKT